MYADDQVIVLLKFALTIGPIAVYFLALGFLNAQPRPQVLTGRTDFMLLAVVFVPLVVWALLLLGSVSPFAVATGGAACLIVFCLLLPPRQSSWVVYNITGRQFQRALGRALAQAGHTGDPPTPGPGARSAWTVPSLGLRIRVCPFPLLQNVTCYFERIDGRPIHPDQLDPLRQSLQASLGATHTLPSASAAAFLLVGTVMLSAPLLLMARHMDAVVKVVSSLFA